MNVAVRISCAANLLFELTVDNVFSHFYITLNSEDVSTTRLDDNLIGK